jgi:ribosome-associated toxin RatA of RatAB toxin-antitoxin module
MNDCDMPKNHYQAQLPYSAQQMFTLVNDIEAYPLFIPGCTAVQIHQQTPTVMIASLEITYAGIRYRLTTQNTGFPYHKIDIVLLEGPFRTFQGQWQFTQNDSMSTCHLSLDLNFEFKNRIMGFILGPVLPGMAQTCITAFKNRAYAVF